MKSFKLACLAAALTLAGGGAAIAATQGALGATSTGQYTNTFGTTVVRSVQVLNLVDTLVLNTSGGVFERYQYATGVVDNFCVVDTTGAAVNLHVSSPKLGAWFDTATAADGSEMNYFLNLSRQDGSAIQRMGNGGAEQPNYVVPAGATVTSAANCAGGNMQKMAALMNPITNNVTFTSNVTLVATPI